MANRQRGRGITDYNWLGFQGQVNAQGAAIQVGTGLVTFGTALTIMRLRGTVLASLDFAAVNEKLNLAVGFILGTDAQVTAGAAAFPSPADGAGISGDWLWHQWIPLMSQGAAQSDSEGNQVSRVVIDSGTPVADIVYGFRVLTGE